MNILAISIVVSISTLLGIIIGILVEKDKKKSINNVHFYMARDKNGELFLYLGKPFRGMNMFHPHPKGCVIKNDYDFSNFGVNQDDYANLKWEDEPVEVFFNMKD